MNLRNFFNKTIILSVFVLAGFLFARSMYYGSFVGMLCAVVAIIAWTMFLYKLSNLQAEDENKEFAEHI